MYKPPLVIYHKQLGDVLLLEPALAKLASWAGGSVTLATRPGFSPMIQLMDSVEPIPNGIFRQASQVVSFDPRSRGCLLSLTTWAREKRLIVSQKKHLKAWHALFFPTQRRVASDSRYYRAEYFFDVMPCESKMAFRPPKLSRPPGDWHPQSLPENYVLLHLTSAWQRKSWLAERWVATINELSRQGWGPFVITGGGAEWEKQYIQTIVNSVDVEIIDINGRTSLSQYLSVIANAKVLLCIDGSSSHIASAFGIPCVTLFGPSNPLHWHCPTQGAIAIDARKYSSEPKPSTSFISVDSVVSASLLLMNN
ncbi:glycosyltransferase family 9 protein [Quatrionicoccus australiensis]|uniref:glycosyltransferase family 9 protein n=1 Tax=Quatrionicoccus australiensis TaxID=138118 RepID=UPI001CF87BB8|nr:glycosyltransferase family 9 protein [Quatrionicoccus australiensis]UCV15262.1 glycosyltransferase family 9 protein [Quatrionicoccus australiensis]